MKYKPIGWIGILIIAAISWPLIRTNFSNTQIFLSVLFSYVGLRFFIYVLKNNKPMW